MPKAMWEKVLVHLDDNNEVAWITRGNGEMQHYKVEPMGLEEFAEVHGANTVMFNNMVIGQED